MTRLLVVLMALLAVAACGKKEEAPAAALALDKAAPANEARRFLAYEHFLQLDTDEAKVPQLFAAAQAACRAAIADQCTLLESRINSGRAVSAALKLRAKPAGIQKIIAALSKQAQVTDQSTTAEDLAGPIGDSTKKLAMLKDYRSKLEALAGRAGDNVDALIKVNRELAQAQSDIETLQGTHAHLLQRVETEILNLSIQSRQSGAFWKPIGFALSDFGKNLAQGTATAITGIAFLLPWVLAIALAWLAGRKLWRRNRVK